MARVPKKRSVALKPTTGVTIRMIRELLLLDILDLAESREEFAKRAQITVTRLIELEDDEDIPNKDEVLMFFSLIPPMRH